MDKYYSHGIVLFTKRTKNISLAGLLRKPEQCCINSVNGETDPSEKIDSFMNVVTVSNLQAYPG